MSLYERAHWAAFNFIARRVVGPAFFLGGLLLGGSNVPSVLPGGVIEFNGAPNDDLVLRLLAVLLPFLLSALGLALTFAPPYKPQRGAK